MVHPPYFFFSLESSYRVDDFICDSVMQRLTLHETAPFRFHLVNGFDSFPHWCGGLIPVEGTSCGIAQRKPFSKWSRLAIVRTSF
jgi:hypothetical protein